VSTHHALLKRGGTLVGGLGGVLATAVFGWTAEGEVSWRGTYDLVMMWVNFGILAFLIGKYARAPLLNMLKREAEKTAADLINAQKGKEQIDRQVEDTLKEMENARERLLDIREKIVAEGAHQRQRIIDSARHESQLLLERTREKIDSQIAEAHARLRHEVVDRAVAVALERLPTVITAEEQLRLVDRFVRETQSS
jgi:F-type H+-transporting ATPase subunit b